MNKDLFGNTYDPFPKLKTSDSEKKKRRWEYGFQKWSDKQLADGYTHYGACGYGVICDFCKDNTFGNPCVRAFNEMLRKKQIEIDYDKITYEQAFDGARMDGE